MKTLIAMQIAKIIGATIVAGDAEALACAGVSTDTRNLPAGCIFIALRGEKFDANTFALQALAAGATVAIVDYWQSEAPTKGAVLLVKDTLLALQKLADWWRDQISLHVIGLTGSNGKTSTKDFIAAILSQRFLVNATRGNLNNHIGLPLTVLATTPEHQAAVWEMGMNHAGEIAPLVAIARPQIAIITNVGSAHIEFLGSREAIAREKASIAANLTAEEVLILPHDCDFMPLIRSLTAARIITTGGADDHIRAENIRDEEGHACFTLRIGAEQQAEIRLGVAGKHMVANALLAAAAANILNISLEKITAGLHQASLTSGRLRRFVSDQITVFDDTYNANPESIIAGLETLAQQQISASSHRYAVLGRMAELGDHAEAAARQVGQHAAKLGITVVAVGGGAELIAASAGDHAKHYSTREAAAEYLQQTIHPGDAILFKGSRTSAMELVMKQLFPNN